MSEPCEHDSDRPELSVDEGTAGASARREHGRRKANREQRVRAAHRRLGALLLALQNEPHDEQAWATGASGEEQVAGRLAKLTATGVILLHDRRVPGSRANIDHVAVAPSGVWVVDTKRYQGKVEVRRSLFRAPKLTIAGRGRSKLVEGLGRQVELVRESLKGVDATAPVLGALCFVDADLPLLGTLHFNGYPLLYVRALAKRISKPGPLSDERVKAIAGHLARRFPAA